MPLKFLEKAINKVRPSSGDVEFRMAMEHPVQDDQKAIGDVKLEVRKKVKEKDK